MSEKTLSTKKFSTRQIAVVGMLSSISIVLGATKLGFIPLPFVSLTIMHIPVIIGALIEGPMVGAMIGLIFGIFSMIQAFTTPSPSSIFFMNPLVAVLPRVLIGITTYYLYKLMKSRFKNDSFNIGFSAVIGSLTNTVGVLGLFFLIYSPVFMKSLNTNVYGVLKYLFAIAYTNGAAEAAVAAVISIPVVTAVKKIRK